MMELDEMNKKILKKIGERAVVLEALLEEKTRQHEMAKDKNRKLQKQNEELEKDNKMLRKGLDHKEQKVQRLLRALKCSRETEDRMRLELEKARAAEKVAKMLEGEEDE